MISKEDYIQGEVESAWEDSKFINQILYEYFENKVANLDNADFKEYLENLGWEVEWYKVK